MKNLAAVLSVAALAACGGGGGGSAAASHYSTVGSYAITECVKDNSTGLTWEGKTADGGLRDFAKKYTNFDSTTLAQYGPNGHKPPTQAEIDAASNTIGYKNAVNATALCGYGDWRLPNNSELIRLELFGKPFGSASIDSDWFPNTQNFYYWTSEPSPSSHTAVGHALTFGNNADFLGVSVEFGRDQQAHVRLVR